MYLGGFEWLILAVLLLGSPALVVFLVWNTMTRKKKQRRIVFDAVFTGAPVVTYQLGPYSPAYEDVVAESVRRGYKLSQQAQPGLLTFTLKTAEP